jgi:hypothetical protein
MTDFSNFFTDAVQYFWSIRSSGAVPNSSAYEGRRGEVVAGNHCDGFFLAIADLLKTAGVDPSHIFVKKRLENQIPGYFRATKNWDLLVVRENKLQVVIEIKSQVGPSFGNNINNRSEEAIGNAVDLWTAYREGGYRNGAEPFLGYVFLLEDCEKSTRPVRVDEPHFPVFDEFREASYAGRYQALCERLVAERLYSAAAFLMSRQEDATSRPNYSEPSEIASSQRFCETLLRHVIDL